MFSTLGYPFNCRDFPFFDKICSKSSAAELLYEGKGLRKFFHIESLGAFKSCPLPICCMWQRVETLTLSLTKCFRKRERMKVPQLGDGGLTANKYDLST